MTDGVATAAGERSAHAPEEARLDAFAASAAHSLGTGVAIASGYATLLRERYAESLGDDGLTALGGLEGGLARMRLFMDDLLQLAALEATPFDSAALELDAIAAAAVDGLAGVLAEGGVTVDAGPLPALAGDGAMLERLFHHLIRGAIAASAPRAGRVAIAGARDGDKVRIEVVDTGPALDRMAAARLFETFAPPRGSGPA